MKIETKNNILTIRPSKGKELIVNTDLGKIRIEEIKIEGDDK